MKSPSLTAMPEARFELARRCRRGILSPCGTPNDHNDLGHSRSASGAVQSDRTRPIPSHSVSNPVSSIDWAKGRELWDKRCSLALIGAELGIGHKRVRSHAIKHRWPLRTRSTLFCKSGSPKEPPTVPHRCGRCYGIFDAPVDQRDHLGCPRARRVAA